MRDALSIFDQVVSFSGNNITYQNVIENLNVLDYDYYFKITDSFLINNISENLLLFNEIIDKGFDAHHFINGLSEHLRNLLVCRDEITLQLLEVGANIRERYREQTKSCTQEFLFKALEISNKCDISYRLSKNKRLHVELTLIELCNITTEKKKSSSLEPDEKFEKKEYKQEVVNDNKSSYHSTNEKKTIEEKKPTPTIIGKPKSFNTFSIKEKMDQSSNNEDKVAEPEIKTDPIKENQNNAFSEKDLVDKWHQFSDNMGNKPRIFNTLTSKDPKLEENNIVSFVIDNNLQEAKINEIRHELLAYLKNELQNSNIDLKIIITDIEAENNKLYTSEDKYNHMLSKNDNLGKLKQEFNLDLE